MPETFQIRLATEVRVAAARTVNKVGLAIEDFLLGASEACWRFQGTFRIRAASVPVVIIQQCQ